MCGTSSEGFSLERSGPMELITAPRVRRRHPTELQADGRSQKTMYLQPNLKDGCQYQLMP